MICACCSNLQFGPYVWKTYGEVYTEVLHIGSALRASGANPVCILLEYIYEISTYLRDVGGLLFFVSLP